MMNKNIKSLTLDICTAENIFLGRLSIDQIIKEFSPPPSDAYTSSYELDGHIFMLARNNCTSTEYITVALSSTDVIRLIPEHCRVEAIDRLLKAGVILLSQSGAIPVNWRPYRAGHFVSIQSNNKISGENTRLVLDTRPADIGGHVFAGFAHNNKEKLEAIEPDYSIFRKAISLLHKLDGVNELPRSDVTPLADGHHLSNTLLDIETADRTYDEWINRLLTKEQIAFVNHPLTSSIRLMGPPGSGKTVALAVKVLKTLAQAQAEKHPLRLLLLTHAMATAELIEYMLIVMDQSGAILGRLPQDIHLDITTIFDLANRQMNFDLDGLKPLSLDGAEGRALQFELLESIAIDFVANEWIAFRSGCSEEFISCMEAVGITQHGRLFVWELMNEFACVLDAEGGRPTGDRRKHYVEEKRKAWMMPINSGTEREAVLELYTKFKEQLNEMQTITGDQMIADHLNWLEMNRWQALRKTKGYDAVFVDELHLFNRQERMVFKKLLRDPEAPPVVVMAFDPKQSPRDTFAGLSSAGNFNNFWQEARLGRTEKIELVDIFRYTPQISNALALLDESFPGQDLEEEWPKYSGVSRMENGPCPILQEFKNTTSLYEYVFPRAKELQRSLGQNRKVAILCASYDLFQKYATASKFKNDFILISSREDLPKVKGTTSKFIFSAPEFVAGLQFDTVFLIEANEDEVPEGAYRASIERKFLSTLYLGASRAERCLEIYSTKEHGGSSRLLNLAISQGAITRID